MNIKYFGEWKDINNNINRVEILTNNVVVNPIEVKIIDFQIEAEIDLFSEDCAMGAGAKFSIVSETKLQYLNDLYAINIKELKVIHYINSEINFVGYLNTEVYDDNFFDRKNYKIDLTANDGLSILNRIKLSNNNSNLFEGIVSSFDVLHAILRKLDTPYRYVNIALSSTIENYTLTSSESLLHKIFVNTDNYVDEKGNVMSCREVLDSILTPLTAKLYIHKNEVYIIDINNLAKDNITFKKYINPNLTYLQALVYDSTYTENNLFDIDVLVGNHNTTYTQGKNKIDVKFNKYIYDNVVELKTLIDNAVSIYKFDVDDNWKIKEYRLSDNSKVRQQIDKTGKERDEYYHYSTVKGYKSKRTSGGGYQNSTHQITGVDFNINSSINITSSKTFLKFNADVMIEDFSNFGKEITSGFFEWPVFLFQFRVGNRYYKNGSWLINNNVNSNVDLYGLSWLPVYITVDDITTTGKHIFNKYYNLDFSLHYRDNSSSLNTIKSLTIPLNSDLSKDIKNRNNSIEGGEELSIKIACPYYLNGKENYYTYRLKNVNISFLVKDEFDNLIELENSDIEVQGTNNDDYIDDIKLEILHGTDEYNNSRGGLLIKKAGLYSDSAFAKNERLVNINNLIRNGNTGQIEELLVNTYLSNLQLPRYILNCSLQGYYKPFQLFKYYLLQRDNKPVKMTVNSIKTDYVNAITQLQLQEIVQDIVQDIL